MKLTIWKKRLSLVLGIVMVLALLPTMNKPALATNMNKNNKSQAMQWQNTVTWSGGTGGGSTIELLSDEDWSTPYTDVYNTDWFYDAVRYVSKNDLMRGTSATLFSPNDFTSRAMLAVALYGLEGTPAVGSGSPFTDVAEGEWYTDAITWIDNNKILMGTGNGTFYPDESLTCELVMIIIYRYAQCIWMDVSAIADLSEYFDADSISSYAVEAMQWAVATGILQGRPTMTIAPREIYSRAEFAASIYRLAEVKNEQQVDTAISADEWANPYTDVTTSDWFFDAVEFVSVKNMMTGTDDAKFSPNVSMTRAMLVTVLYRLAGEPNVSGKIPFSDVDGGKWYSDAILWASKNKIVEGYSNGTFGWSNNVTREQVVTILCRYAKSVELDVSISADLSGYKDLSDISDWALDAMKWAIGTEIVQGRTSATIAPQGTTTRAEVAMIFSRYIQMVINYIGISNADWAGVTTKHCS